MSLKYLQRGDTIVEVMFAVAVFGLVAVGCMSIMNKGTATAERSLEVTLVREQIDAQAATIRYIHQAYINNYQKGATITPANSPVAYQWIAMTSKATGRGEDTASSFGQLATINGQPACPASAKAAGASKPFVLDPRKATILNTDPTLSPPAGGSLPPFAQVYDNGVDTPQAYGLWVEAVPSTTAGNVGFVDFHIRACWDTVGSNVPSTLGTIVRLYEPR